MFLFGSHAKGKPHKNSDIDVAIWDTRFSGCLPLDVENLKSILSKYSSIELHTFNMEDLDSPSDQDMADLRLDEGFLMNDLNKELLQGYALRFKSKALDHRVNLLLKTYEI